ncbi:uncharacterized protein EMH_0080560 [Eimeria mitis]|uniref:Uncharacterized protein n=1 Tax=Eimeria mitis TaxID=44415 RepID=U6K2P5_9EIME|nr:uncharacterized protein EMH_0059710 [Eimeria mitis]XP_013355731.1 uncharacterized protein EMH_0080560 [Eimeria mitis]CDJ30597.1 hypothetical protein EMH_0059710 [Eimeria mitis]CDJ33167.1 hypothetical protein, conserved [Eimeria mitis]
MRDKVEHMPPPRGIRSNPNYNITAEKLAAAAAKLHMPLQQDQQSFAALEGRRRALALEPERLLGGGRYAV